MVGSRGGWGSRDGGVGHRDVGVQGWDGGLGVEEGLGGVVHRGWWGWGF